MAHQDVFGNWFYDDGDVDLVDSHGNPLFSNDPTDPSGAIDSVLIDLINYGLPNGNFGRGPSQGPGSQITPDNPMPYWGTPVLVSGVADTIRLSQQINTATPSAFVLRYQVDVGALNDEVYEEALIPVGGDYGLTAGYGPRLAGTCPAISGGTIRVSLEMQYVKADKATTTGAATTITKDVTGTGDFIVYSTTNVAAPADASFLRVRLRVKRQAGTSNTAIIDLANVRFDRTVTSVILADRKSPGTHDPGRIYQEDGQIFIVPTRGAPIAASSTYVGIASGSIGLFFGTAFGGVDFGVGSGIIGMVGTLVGGDAFPITISEGAAPATPQSGYYSVYATDGVLYGKNDAGVEVPLGAARLVPITDSITGNQNNYGPPGLANGAALKVDCGGAARTVSGFDASLFTEGDTFYISGTVLGAGKLNLPHRSGSSSPGNRINTPRSGATVALDFFDWAKIAYLPSLDSTNPFHVLGTTL